MLRSLPAGLLNYYTVSVPAGCVSLPLSQWSFPWARVRTLTQALWALSLEAKSVSSQHPLLGISTVSVHHQHRARWVAFILYLLRRSRTLASLSSADMVTDMAGVLLELHQLLEMQGQEQGPQSRLQWLVSAISLHPSLFPFQMLWPSTYLSLLSTRGAVSTLHGLLHLVGFPQTLWLREPHGSSHTGLL